MKYTIVINQLILATTNLDIADAAILDYLIDYCGSLHKKVEASRITGDDGQRYTWIDYAALLADMPILRINQKGALTPRFKKIEEAGFIVTTKGQGFKLYVRLTDKVHDLFFKERGTNAEKPAFTEMNADTHASVHEKQRQRSRKATYYNTSNSDTNDNTKLAKPNLKTKRANVEKSVDNSEQAFLIDENNYVPAGTDGHKEIPGPKGKKEGMVSLSDAIASARPMFEATMQITPDKNITTEHQAYGLMVSEHLSLPSFYNARIIKGVKNKPLDIIEHAIAVTRNARVMDPDERIKYFFRCLRNGR